MLIYEKVGFFNFNLVNSLILIGLKTFISYKKYNIDFEMHTMYKKTHGKSIHF